MTGIVPPAVAQVDPTDEGHVLILPARMSKHHELLVVAASPADPLVEQHLAPGLVQDLSELEVLLLAELRLVRMRPPHQTPHVDAASGQLGQHLAQGGTRAVQQLVWIPRQSVKKR